MAADLSLLLADLVAESAALEVIVEPLQAEHWQLPTTAAGWRIADQMSHLAYFDDAALLSVRDPAQFRRDVEALLAAGDGFPDKVAVEHRHLTGLQLLQWFRGSRMALVDCYASLEPTKRLPWYGPDMGLASSITARLMETWAHGQDIVDALGIERPATTRLRHIADLGVRSLPYAYAANGLVPPATPIRVELVAPDGSCWAWGPAAAGDRVSGTALDFCLAVTQRRHLDNTGLVVSGPVAQRWMGIAQAFAGPPGPGRDRIAP